MSENGLTARKRVLAATIVVLSAGAALSVACSSGSPGVAPPPSSEGGRPDSGLVDASPTRDSGDGGVREGGPHDAACIPDASPEAAPFAIAHHPSAPQVVNNGGVTLTHPVATAVTFAGYDMTEEVEDFVETVGSTPYWSGAVSQYGIGPLNAAVPVRLASHAPTMTTNTEIQTWIADQFDGTHPEFGTPTPDSLFVFFYPSTTTITESLGFDAGIDSGLDLQSCVTFAGYHSSVQIGAGPWSGQNVVFAVVPECGGSARLDTVTGATSHELVEAVTDPLADYGYTGWGGVDQDHLAWAELFIGTELGDMCELNSNAFFVPQCYSFQVQRIWSNLAATAGHDPCQPNSETYFNAAPVLADEVMIMNPLEIGTIQTLGAFIPLGESKTVEVDLFSDGPSTPWAVSADDLSDILGGGPYLSFSFDQTTGQNGDKLHMTITAIAQNFQGNELFEVVSTNGSLSHTWYGIVSQSSAAGDGGALVDP
jgi:hypothetical protein